MYVYVSIYCPVLVLVTIVMYSGLFPSVLLLLLLLRSHAYTSWVKCSVSLCVCDSVCLSVIDFVSSYRKLDHLGSCVSTHSNE